jgi:hypothetical protein
VNLSRLGVAAATALLLTVAPSPAVAGQTIGQAPPIAGAPASCGANTETVPLGVASGNGYEVPGFVTYSVITEWSTFATQADIGDQVALRTYRGSASHAESDTGTIQAAGLNTFPTQMPVMANDQIGLLVGDDGPDNESHCVYEGGALSASHDAVALVSPISYFQQQVDFGQYARTAARVDVSATLEGDADQDAFGDESQDDCPLQADTQGRCDLAVDLERTPKAVKARRSATIGFSGVGDVTFECRLNDDDFDPCSSPEKVKQLDLRRHVFRVRALDHNGRSGGAAKARWRVTAG